MNVELIAVESSVSLSRLMQQAPIHSQYIINPSTSFSDRRGALRYAFRRRTKSENYSTFFTPGDSILRLSRAVRYVASLPVIHRREDCAKGRQSSCENVAKALL